MSSRIPGCYPLEVLKHCTHKLTSHATLTEQGKGACGAVISLLVSVLFATHFHETVYKALASKSTTLV